MNWRKVGLPSPSKEGYSLLAHITSSRYEDIKNWCSFWDFSNWRSRLDEINSPQINADPLVMIWYMIRIHLSRKLAPSFLPNTLDNKITMIWTLFLNLEVFHSADADLALNCPLDHHPFIMVRKSTNSFFFLIHSGVTLIWASLKWYIWLKTDAL